VKVVAREGPLKGPGERLVVALAVVESLGESGERGEVVRGEYLALEDGEVDLDLIEPTGMDGPVDQDQVG